MDIVCLGLIDDFDLIIPQTQATASLPSQLSAFPEQMRGLGWRQIKMANFNSPQIY